MIRTSFKILGFVAVIVAALLAIPGQSQAHCHGGCGWGGHGYGGWGYGGYGYGGGGYGYGGWGYGDYGYGGYGFGGLGYGGWGYSGYGYGGGGYSSCGYSGCGYGGGASCGYGYGGCGYGCGTSCGYGGYGTMGVVSDGCGCGSYVMAGASSAAQVFAPAAPAGAPTPAILPASTPVLPKPGSTLHRPNDSATVTVSVPENAKVYVKGYLTKSTGNDRQYVFSGLKPGFSYECEVRAEITRDGKTIEETHSVVLSAGAQSTLSFKFDAQAVNVASTW